MADIPVTAVKEYKSNFRRFGGVDFTSAPTQVAAHRSPDACNMIANEKFFPIKRPGYESVRRYDAKVYGLHRLVGDDENVHLFTHAGKNLYYDEDMTPVYTDMAEDKSRSFVMNGRLYILDGATYLQVSVSDGVCAAQPAANNAFVPTTSIARTSSGAGTAFEAVNLLTRRRKNSFAGDGVSNTYILDFAPIESVEEVIVANEEVTEYTVDLETGHVIFSALPPNGNGVDNIVITFTAGGDNKSTIDKCRVCGLFGGNNDTRVFVSGNEEMPNADWQSGLYDPTYFPDTGYTKIGADTSAIMGYARQYDTQIVIKEGNGQDATQWLRTFSLDSENRPKYAVMQGAVGDGAIGRDTFDVLGDSPLFLSPAGVCAVVGTTVSQQRSVQNRSMLINKQLREEADETACAAAVGNKYYLSCGGHMYVADGAQTYEDENGNVQYEWYYWTGIEPTAMIGIEGQVWFGTQDGRLCKLGMIDDPDILDDDGQAFSCWWTTPQQSLNSLYRNKTVRDVSYMLMPYSQSEYKVYYRSDRRDWTLMRQGSLSMFDFNNWDFNDFSFFCSVTPITERTRRKERRAEVFQVQVRNDEPGTQFGLLGIEITYRYARKTR